MSRPYSIKDAIHRDSALSVVIEKEGSLYFLATKIAIPTTPTISTVTTTDANWTAVATGITGMLVWRLTELVGGDFHYAYEAAPGNNFQVGFGWVSYNTCPSAIYIKRPGSTNITIKFEKWEI